MQNKEENSTQLIFVLLGISLTLYANPVLGTDFPRIIIAFVYFSLLGIIKRKWEYVFLIGSTFVFLGIFFSFLDYKSITLENIFLALNSNKTVITLYTFVLSPFLWLSHSLNFFQLSKQLSFVFSKGILRYIIPIILKLELIQNRYRSIMETFLIKGFDTRSYFGRMLLTPKWIIPLIVTTLMEGVESYHYNARLKTKTESLRKMTNTAIVPMYKKLTIVFLFSLITIFFFYEKISTILFNQNT